MSLVRARAYLDRAPQRTDYDLVLVWSAVLLLAIGVVMVYSASIASAEVDRHTGYRTTFYLVRHAIYVALGAGCALAAMQIPLRTWQRLAPYLFLGSAALLVLVFVPGLGREVNGSRRWLSLLVFNLQPSELVKVAVVLYAADYTVRKAAFMNSIKRGFMPMFLAMVVTGSLLLREPDFGAFVVITTIAMTLLFLGGMNWRLFVALVVLLLASFVLLIVTSPYRMQRFLGSISPWDDPFGRGYQLSHALIAFGRGEWFGVGLGSSVEKLLYLPEAHTDFLLAVIGEELGFVGVAVVIALFTALIVRAFAIGNQAASLERYYAALVAYGIAVWLGAQALINMGVNLGILPTKGLTLPLLSFGGSGIVANCIALGILMRVDLENRQLMRGVTP